MKQATETLMRLPAVMEATGYGRSSIYSLIKQKKFPDPVSLAGGGAVAWRKSEVQAWIDGQAGNPQTGQAERMGAKYTKAPPNISIEAAILLLVENGYTVSKNEPK